MTNMTKEQYDNAMNRDGEASFELVTSSPSRWAPSQWPGWLQMTALILAAGMAWVLSGMPGLF